MVEVLVKSEFTNGSHILYPEWTLATLSNKLERITGIPPESQRVVLTAPNKSLLLVQSPINTDQRPLESLNIPEFSELLVEDTRNESDRLDLAKRGDFVVPKLTEDEYASRPNTLLQFKRENKLGRFSKTFTEPSACAPNKSPKHFELRVQLHDECLVNLQSGLTARGIVAFIGEVKQIEAGTWVGINLFTPVGRNNGVVAGTKLFDAKPNHGVLVRPAAVRPLAIDEEEL